MVIFHIGEDYNGIKRKVVEVSVMNATSQLMHPESFVETGFDILRAYEDPTKDKDGYLVDQITQNGRKDLCIQMQKRLNFDEALNFNDLKQTPICYSVFKTHAEVDLVELERVLRKIQKRSRLENIDF